MKRLEINMERLMELLDFEEEGKLYPQITDADVITKVELKPNAILQPSIVFTIGEGNELHEGI